MTFRPGVAVLATALVLTGCATAGDEKRSTITVFAAASLTDVFGLLETRFEQLHPSADVVLNVGGSGALAVQITEGAPADVFAAASEAPMTAVVESGDVAESTVFAANTLEIVVPAGNPGGITGLAGLADPALVIALCDPAVPCGASAEALMRSAGLVAAPDTLEQDVKAVLTKVELGEADAGLVYATDVVAAAGTVEGISVPEAAGVINRYPIAVISGARNPEGARAWVDFVLSADGKAALAAAGFLAP